ncbi:MAG: hypothetical protein KJ561_01470 [Nanoarchaeota archaeon]|nr:hypothetical protein [Nanoarchaeota archaeon]
MSQRVSFYVNKYIEGDPTIKVGLQRGLITSRILTKHIIEEEREFKGSFDDVRNAVRKYTDEDVSSFSFKNIYNAFKDSHIDVRSNLASIEISRNDNTGNNLKIINEILSNNENFFQVIMPEEDIDRITKLIKNQDIISPMKGVSCITIFLDSSVKYTPGIYFLIMGQISLNQINIYDVSSHESEFSVYIDEKDGAKVHQLLYELAEYQKKFCKNDR